MRSLLQKGCFTRSSFTTLVARAVVILAVCLFAGCKEDTISTDAALTLRFSCDSLAFDTIFTAQGTATQQVMVYNPNDNAVALDRVWLDGSPETGRSYFSINLDGENNPTYMSAIEVRGHDSLYLFVKANIDPLDSNTPLLIEDQLHILVNGNTATLKLSAIGWDVTRLRTPKRLSEYDTYSFTADRPYLIFDTVLITDELSLLPGARLFMHSGSAIICTGSIEAEGDRDAPITIQGDRLDRLFDSVPYAYAAGQWGGIYCLTPESKAPTYSLDYVNILSGNIGLYIQHPTGGPKPQLRLTNSRIHNHSLYGIVLINADAEVINTEISNAAQYCVFLAGGEHRFLHSTIASFFNYTNIRIQSVPRQSVPAVYIDSVSADAGASVSSFTNCIIDGLEPTNLYIAGLDTANYAGSVHHCYLHSDTLHADWAYDNVYYRADTSAVFKQNFYRYKEYIYYNFSLDSLSPARGIADPEAVVVPYDYDRRGIYRLPVPDAGCYQYRE